MGSYKIVGSDGQQYAPVSAEEMRQWVPGGGARFTAGGCGWGG